MVKPPHLEEMEVLACLEMKKKVEFECQMSSCGPILVTRTRLGLQSHTWVVTETKTDLFIPNLAEQELEREL